MMAYPVTVTTNLTKWTVIACVAVMVSACQNNSEEDWLDNEQEDARTCERAHPESVSCGWPVYLPDGTRIDEPSGVVADA